MFLSKLVLNRGNANVRRDLARPYEMHRTLMNAYGQARVENRCDLLFRVEPWRGGATVVLVQTREDPQGWTQLPPGYLLHPCESKCVDLAPVAGQRLRFRLRANPTKRVASGNERLGASMAGKRIGLISEAEQVRWLLRKAEAAGFHIPGEWLKANRPETDEPVLIPNFRVEVIPEGRARNAKPGHGGEFLAVRFEGTLVVTDAEKFRAALASGIGSAKAFGFGLLSVGPA